MECSPAPQLRLRRTLFWPCWVPFVTVLVVYKHWVNADFRKITLKCVAKEPRAAWYFNSSNYHLKFQFVRSVSFCVFVGRLFSIFVLKWSPFRCCVSRCWLQSVTWRWTVWTVWTVWTGAVVTSGHWYQASSPLTRILTHILDIRGTSLVKAVKTHDIWCMFKVRTLVKSLPESVFKIIVLPLNELKTIPENHFLCFWDVW